jgi:hypothetical protein
LGQRAAAREPFGSDAMSGRIDYAKAYYWRVEFIEPSDPEDDRYVMLHGDEGEVVGPLTMSLAETWMNRFNARRPRSDERGEFPSTLPGK